MGTASVLPANQSPMRYRIIPTPEGFQLDLWEVPAANTSPHKPFLFRVSYSFATLALAEAALTWYLDHNTPVAPPQPPRHWLATVRQWFRRHPTVPS